MTCSDVTNFFPATARAVGQDREVRRAHAGVHVPLPHDAELLAGQHFVPRLPEEKYHIWGTSRMMQFMNCRQAATSGARTSSTAPSSAVGTPALGRTDSQPTTTSTSIRGRRRRKTASARGAHVMWKRTLSLSRDGRAQPSRGLRVPARTKREGRTDLPPPRGGISTQPR
jgi:hypothetical protein